MEEWADRRISRKAAALERADALREAIRRHPLPSPAAWALREEIRLREIFESNAIEGSRLSLEDTIGIVRDGMAPAGGARVRDIFAAKGYADGFDAVMSRAERGESCSEAFVLSLHRLVLAGAQPECCGVWRNHAVRFLGARFRPAEPAAIPERMRSLLAGLNDAGGQHPLEAAAQFHAEFETIYPFADGNGRTGRLLLNFLLVKAGFWPVVIRCREDRDDYFSALAAFRADGHADALAILIAEREAEVLERCLRAARQQSSPAHGGAR